MKIFLTILFLTIVLCSSAQTKQYSSSDTQTYTRVSDFFVYVTPERDTMYMTNCEMSSLTLGIWTQPIYANDVHPVFILTSIQDIKSKWKTTYDGR